MNDSTPNLGFWGRLEKPIYALAPMADVTDTAFRQIVARRGKPSLFMTEFVSVDGLCSRGRQNLMKHLWYDESERPIVAQIFGNKPELYFECARFLVDQGFDGIDINMGCPVKVVTKIGCGAAMIKTPELAKEIIYETMRGAGDIPVSVKTRIGYNSIVIEEWVSHLIETRPAAITLHLRTAKEMSQVEAHWPEMYRAVKLVKGSGTLLLGNGDVRDLDHADQLIRETGIDGVMFGRAVFGHPWLFDRSRSRESVTVEEKLQLMVEHANLYDKCFARVKSFLLMRKHLLAHANGFNGAKELRMLLQQVENAEDVRRAVGQFRGQRQSTEV